MVRVGIIGLGFMGRMHFNILREMENVNVAALCDIDPAKRAGGWKMVRGNIETSATPEVDMSQFDVYDDGFKMFAQAEIDAVLITLPTFLHARYSVAALEAGKNVIVEKPMACTVAECEAMLDAANRTVRRLLVGQCVRFWPDYTVAREIIRSNKYGKVRSAAFRRVGGVPLWSWDDWYRDGFRSGGALLDLHVHDIDYIQNLFGMPAYVSATGSIDVCCRNGAIDNVSACYHYPGGPAVTALGSWYIGGVPFEMSFIIALEGATLIYNSQTGTRLTVCLPGGENVQPELPAGDGYSNEHAYFMDIISRKAAPELMPPEQARNNIAIALAERESILAGKSTRITAD